MVNSRNKVELNRLSQVNNNEQNFLAALNENLKRIQVAINDTLSRTGVIPNQMEEVLDMNGHRMVNVGRAVEPTDVVTKQDIQDIIDAAEEAIAQLDHLVEDAKVALQLYVEEYVLPLVDDKLVGTYIYGGTFDSTTATASLTDRAKARLNTQSNSIVLTNDTTDITGYKDNEGINYYVSTDGTFASLTLHEGDILWSTGTSWKKIDNHETVLPEATEATKGIVQLSTVSQATDGSNDATAMTPLKVKKAVSEQTFNSLSSSQESSLLLTGKYMNDYVASGTVFETEDGVFKEFSSSSDQPLTWDVSEDTPPSQIRGCAYGANKFVVVPTGSYSTDGIHWTDPAENPVVISNMSAPDLKFINNRFVLVSDYLKGYYSLDGITWTDFDMPYRPYWGGVEWTGVAYGNGKYVAVIDDDIACSTDLENWTLSFDPELPPISAKRITFGNGRFVVIGSGDHPFMNGTNGTSWSACTLEPGLDGFAPGDVVFCSGVFIATGGFEDGDGRDYAYSTDGITWYKKRFPEFPQSIVPGNDGAAVYVGDNYFMAVGRGAYSFSTDGITWTNWEWIFEPDEGVPFESAAYGNSVWVAIPSGGGAYYYGTMPTYTLTPLSYSKEDIDDKKYIQNNATQSSSVAILGSSSSYQSIAIGLGSSAGNFGTAIGRGARTVNNSVNMALGYGAETGPSVTESIQIGRGTNTESTTLKVGFLENNYKLLDGTTGKIPAERYTAMTGATSSVAGTVGAVPAPTTADVNKYLKGDGTWGDVSVQPATYDSSTSTITL